MPTSSEMIEQLRDALGNHVEYLTRFGCRSENEDKLYEKSKQVLLTYYDWLEAEESEDEGVDDSIEQRRIYNSTRGV